MRVRFAGLTDVGRTRDNNEDAFFLSDDEPMCFVADGMGGHSSGELASALALEAIRVHYRNTRDADGATTSVVWPERRKPPGHEQERRIVEALLLANEVVFQEANVSEERAGMGTTLVGGYFLESGVYVAHIGDSRAYRLRGGNLERITRDHSLADEYLRMGLLRELEVGSFPYRNVITRAVGLRDLVEPEVNFLTHQPGDLFLFCSDGLTDPLEDREIEYLMRHAPPQIEALAQILIDAANESGGPDNITAILAEVVADH